ncbi:MAG: hypothetical protein ABF746_06465, partial [Acetobacter orientalis]|uniref:hypothetical protein n=1 Tax=Acetobacter orientalis TaxID=146474 RepID=UPI0039E87FFA
RGERELRSVLLLLNGLDPEAWRKVCFLQILKNGQITRTERQLSCYTIRKPPAALSKAATTPMCLL